MKQAREAVLIARLGKYRTLTLRWERLELSEVGSQSRLEDKVQLDHPK
jgi:hypothetical protein